VKNEPDFDATRGAEKLFLQSISKVSAENAYRASAATPSMNQDLEPE
jgi:hypothetical protein